MRKRLILYLLIMGILLAGQVRAGSLTVTPIRVFLEGKKTTTLKVKNNREERMTIQVRAVTWRQDEEGQDRLEPTKEITFFPKIFSIEPGEGRVIRIGYQGEWPRVEKTYRVFLQELPTERPGETAIKMALEISMPLFVSPMEKARKVKRVEKIEIEKVSIEEIEPPEREIGAEEEKAEPAPSKKMLVVRVRNQGDRHFSVKKIRVSGLDGSKREVFSKEVAGWYVLSGVSKPFIIEMTPEECQGSELIKIRVETENSSREAEWQVGSEG